MSWLIDALQAEPRQLIALWRDVFGDPPELPAAFLRQLPAIGCGWAAVEEGHVLGAAYWIDALYLGEERCGYLYAVAVRPEARGQGLGAALSRACWESGRERGAVYACTEPAEDSLFDWYGDIVGARPVLYRKATELAAAAGAAAEPISAEDYALRREILLKDRLHVRYAPEALIYEQANCRCYGGDLYRIGEGIADAIREDGVLLVRECLGPEPEALAASLGAALGCERIRLLRSAAEGERFLAGNRVFPADTIFNITFD
jgi:GNAT superfamily N-acetyltransferase